MKKITTYKEFWPFYLQEHSHPVNRKLHFIGTSLVILFFVTAFITQKYALLWFCPIAGYSFAWIGHFKIEHNRPATFKHPFWSLISDFKMFWFMLTGKLK